MPKVTIDYLAFPDESVEERWLRICNILSAEGFEFTSRDKEYGPRNILAPPFSANSVGEALVEFVQYPGGDN